MDASSGFMELRLARVKAYRDLYMAMVRMGMYPMMWNGKVDPYLLSTFTCNMFVFWSDAESVM